MPRIKSCATALSAGALLLSGAGCTVGPRYATPKPQLPSAYVEQVKVASEAPPESIENWWKMFGDPELDSLIERALQNNRDIKVAASRLRQARWERVAVAGALIPDLSATGGYQRGRGSKNVVLPFGGAAPPQSQGRPAASALTSAPTSREPARALEASPPNESSASAAGAPSTSPPGGPASPLGEGGFPGVTTNLYQVGFDAVWEIDLFGGTRRAIEAQDATTEGMEAAAAGVRVSLLAEVATAYLQLKASQIREAIARANLKSEETLLKVDRDKFHAGFLTDDAVARQEAQVASLRATLPAITLEQATARHSLEFLLGENPGALSSELTPSGSLPALPPAIPRGVPSDLLRRRPDIRQAERALAAATAQIGEATAQLFPQFSLTGSFGLDSSDVKHLPAWGSRYYSISPGIRWPILDWSKVHAAIRITDEGERQALLSYESTVAQALKEVEDALVRYGADTDRREALEESVRAARRAQTVTQQSYGQGLTDILASLEAERSILQAEDSLAQAEAALRADLVTLYKALGGGWDAPAIGEHLSS